MSVRAVYTLCVFMLLYAKQTVMIVVH